MKTLTKLLSVGMAGISLCGASGLGATTDGVAKLEVTLVDIPTSSSGTRHFTVAWVTTSANAFIKTLRMQGPAITATHWNSHCSTWWAAKGSSTALDGYTSATAANYTGTNSPVILTWNCLDQNTNLVADGDYRFWVQYAEDTPTQGPVTAGGLLWTKGASSSTTNFTDVAGSFTNMKVTYTVRPQITSATMGAGGLVLSGKGSANGSYAVLETTDITLPTSQWTATVTNSIGPSGSFSYTNAIAPGSPTKYIRLRAQ